MTEAFAWGLVASSSVLLGGAVALIWPVHRRLLGLVMAFGAGVLISAVAFELVAEAFAETGLFEDVAVGLFAGCAAFAIGDAAIDRMGGEARKRPDGGDENSSALAIVLGIVLDGVPESAVIGLTLLEGGAVSAAMLAAVFVSNIPEALAATAGLVEAGWRRIHVLLLWSVVVLVSGVSALAGYALLDGASATTIAFVLAFAAGAILTMLADTMMPEAYAHGGKLVGVFTTFGFATAFAITSLD